MAASLFVVPVDFSAAMESTVSTGFALAKQCGADVHLLEVVRPRGPSLVDVTADIRLRRSKRILS
jgi:nucleotide-binding universal stress UspA family protein